MNDRVSITVKSHVADVRLTRGDKLNALDPSMFEGIIEAGERLAAMQDVRAVVLSGEGRGFCAGLDMASMTAASSSSASASADRLTTRTHGNCNDFQQVSMLWRKLPMPVIAAVHGVCFGGGLQIASGADMRIVAPTARMAVMEMKWGLIPDMGGYALWRGLVREDLLRELTYTNREFSGTEALELGFASCLDENPHERAMEMALQIANRNPEAVRESKALFNEFYDMDETAILMAESVRQARVMRTPNQIEAVMAQMQKRSAIFTD